MSLDIGVYKGKVRMSATAAQSIAGFLRSLRSFRGERVIGGGEEISFKYDKKGGYTIISIEEHGKFAAISAYERSTLDTWKTYWPIVYHDDDYYFFGPLPS